MSRRATPDNASPSLWDGGGEPEILLGYYAYLEIAPEPVELGQYRRERERMLTRMLTSRSPWRRRRRAES